MKLPIRSGKNPTSLEPTPNPTPKPPRRVSPSALAIGLVLAVFAAAVAYATTGTLIINGSTSGSVTVQAPAVAGSTTFQLPGNNGTSGFVLSTDGSGNTSWISNAGTASTALSGLTAAAATHTIQNANFPQTWAWGTLGANTALSLSSTGMTTGTLLNLSNTDTAANAGTVLSVSNSEAGGSTGISSSMLSATNTGYAGYFSNATTNSGYAVYGTMTAHGNTGYAGYFVNTDTSGNQNYGVYGIVNSTNYYSTGVYGLANATTGPATGIWGVTNSTGYSAATAGTANATTGTAMGVYGSSASTGVGMGVYGNMTGTANTGYAGYFSNTGTGALNYGVYASTSSTTGYAGYFNGPVKINGSGAGNINLFINGRIQTGDGSYSGGMWVDSANSMFMGAYSSNVMGFYNTGWTGLVQTSTGSVGIGTTAPAEPLHVYTSTTSAVVEEIQNGTGHCTVTPASSGNVSFACSSDVRLKKDIVDTGDALAWIDSIRVRDFTMKSDGSRQTGVIAQEMLKDNSDMVHMGDDGYYTVDSPDLWKMIKAIQQQQAEIVVLQRELDALKTQNQAMHTDFEAYKHAHP
jgi:hypothetical protein